MKKLTSLFCIVYAITSGKGYLPNNLRLIKEHFGSSFNMKSVSNRVRKFHEGLVVHEAKDCIHYQSIKTRNEFVFSDGKWYAIVDAKCYPIAKKYHNAVKFLCTGSYC